MSGLALAVAPAEEDVQQIMISKHAKERYCERVLKMHSNDVTKYITENDEGLTLEIMEFCRKAEFIWQGDMTGKINTYYINDKSILTMNEASDALITILPIEFGFSSDINNQVRELLVSEIFSLRDKLSVAIELAEANSASINANIAVLEDEIAIAERSLVKMRSERELLTQQREVYYAEIGIIEEKLAKDAKMLCRSINQKLDMEAHKRK